MADFNGEKDYVILQRRLMMYVWYMRDIESVLYQERRLRGPGYFYRKMVNSNQVLTLC